MSEINRSDEGWDEFLSFVRPKVRHFYHIDDVERNEPYKINNFSKDYLTGEKLITIYTQFELDEELFGGHYKTITLNVAMFKKNFIQVEEDI